MTTSVTGKPGLTLGLIDPFHPAIVETIRTAMPGAWRLSVAEAPTPAARAAALSKADVAFVMATPLPRALLDAAPRLCFIHKLGAGTDTIDTRYCAETGIMLARLQAGNAIPVAEHTVSLMLAACRQLQRLDRRTREGHWDKEAVRGVNRHLFGKTVGIVGLGAIGRRVAEVLSGFGVTLVYHDMQPVPGDVERALGVAFRPLDVLLAEADVVTLHLPLTPQTRHLLSAERIARMKRSAILVNTARGGIVDEAALERALCDGQLHGAAIDVFATEPPKDSALFDLENTIVTPHCSGATIDNFANVAERAVRNTLAVFDGRALDPAEVVIPPGHRLRRGA